MYGHQYVHKMYKDHFPKMRKEFLKKAKEEKDNNNMELMNKYNILANEARDGAKIFVTYTRNITNLNRKIVLYAMPMESNTTGRRCRLSIDRQLRHPVVGYQQ